MAVLEVGFASRWRLSLSREMGRVERRGFAGRGGGVLMDCCGTTQSARAETNKGEGDRERKWTR